MPTKIALSIAVVIGVASSALAGPKDPAWPTTSKSGGPAQERQVSASGYASFASASDRSAPARVPAMWAHPH